MAQWGGVWRERSARPRAFYREGILRGANGKRPIPGFKTGDGPCDRRLGDLPPVTCCQWFTGSAGRR
ncbi:hypothetical protein CHT98_17035 (plasmid) [Azospirillum brasilense]|uniref:Uncharacterized protein n=1 Tax=Azospirillum brasilense TaxID=192 RepID=A0A235HBK1_AZOBR|nr:hypothetical protein CHT98_17035 [Azospirillum brasilense]